MDSLSMLFASLFIATATPAAEELYSEESHPEAYCLALNVYHEARGDILAGQYAVSDVVLNRVESKKYPNTVCEVIRQAKMSTWWKKEHGKDVPVKNKCQFSWYCDGKSDEPKDEDAWRRSQAVAYRILFNDDFRGISEGSLYYHATYVNPKWNKSFYLVGRIGDHVFYREY